MILAIFKQIQNEISDGYELCKTLIQKISKYLNDRLVVSYKDSECRATGVFIL